MKLLSWSTGKKTYITVAVGIAVGAAQAYGLHIPSWVNWLLTFAGIGFTRSAVSGCCTGPSGINHRRPVSGVSAYSHRE
jgi:hypothetical protein